MKKLLLVCTLGITLFACKRQEETTTSKDLILMPDGTSASYLSDTGKIVTNADAADVPSRAVEASTPTRRTTTPARTSSSGSRNTGTVYNNGSSGSSGTTTTAPAKRGISSAAKGAIIGGVGGAVAGAVIGKNAKGAAIGGAVGAAGGYIIGRSKDRKTGRVQ